MGTKHGLTPQERFWPKVDKTSDPNGCWLWTAGLNDQGYGKFRHDGKARRAHRFAYELLVGEIPKHLPDLDHTCHVRHCVNPDHLRPTTHKQNMENRSGRKRNNTSGYVGVDWSKQAQKWRARVKANYKDVHVGFFDDVHEAGEAARLKRLVLQTHNDMDRQ